MTPGHLVNNRSTGYTGSIRQFYRKEVVTGNRLNTLGIHIQHLNLKGEIK